MTEMYELIALIAVLIAIAIPIPLVVFIVLSFQRRADNDKRG